MKRILIGFSVLTVAAIAAPKVWPLVRAKFAAGPGAPMATVSPESAAGKRKKGDGGGPMRVDAVTLIPTQLAETISSTGTLRAEEGVELQAETNGKVAMIA